LSSTYHTSDTSRTSETSATSRTSKTSDESRTSETSDIPSLLRLSISNSTSPIKSPSTLSSPINNYHSSKNFISNSNLNPPDFNYIPKKSLSPDFNLNSSVDEKIESLSSVLKIPKGFLHSFIHCIYYFR
jgi:hypothetical protein